MAEDTIYGYVTLQEANTYIAEHYMSTDALRTLWVALQEEDKAVLLRKAFQAIESLPYTGRKYDFGQTSAWPRCPWGAEVPDAIKQAQIEQALVGADASADEETKHYEKLWMWGVSSYSIGNLSESISEGTYGAGGARTYGITSSVAARLLAPFLQGGFSIR